MIGFRRRFSGWWKPREQVVCPNVEDPSFLTAKTANSSKA
jgi:hypothetical protein